MSQTQVRILCQVITAQLGTLNTGDIVRTDEAFAKHLVDDCGAAEYLQTKSPESADEEQPSGRGGKSRKTPAQKSPDASPAPVIQNPAPPAPQVVPAGPVQTSAPAGEAAAAEVNAPAPEGAAKTDSQLGASDQA